MLAPDDRHLLVDLLAPPEPGFVVDRAVGTTFTLDLSALLPVPLAMAGAELTGSSDPLGVMQAVRRFADRIDVFCQTGQVAVPSDGTPLLAFLEPVVHQVKRPSPGRLFHPKVWVLRYRNDDGDIRFRMICGSRNLTNDRAWDAVVSLTGSPTGRRRAVNRPLADFAASLPSRTVGGMPADRVDAIGELADSLRTVEWERPPSVLGEDWLAFHVLGPGRRAAPDLGGYRRLIISPFLNEGGLAVTWPEGEGTILTRAEELDVLPDSYHEELIARDADLRVLDDDAAIPDIDSDEAGPRWSLNGLHAKVYVVERSRRAHVFIGSANATDAAWSGNDEVLVEIVGKTKAYGVDAVLKDTEGGFGTLLLPYNRTPIVTEPPDADLQRRLENWVRAAGEVPFAVTAAQRDGTWSLAVTTDVPLPAFDGEVLVTLRPLTVGTDRAALAGDRVLLEWELAQAEDITPFLVLTASAKGEQGALVTVSSTVVGRLEGGPEDRLDRLLARHIESPEAFIRFLLLLLQLGRPDEPAGDLLGSGLGAWASRISATDGSGLLEAITMALAESPTILDEITSIVDRMTATEQGRALLPEGWSALWPEVTRARELLEEAS